VTGLVIAAVAIVAAYGFGSVPWGVVLGRMLKGIDIRELGSGNTGATNSLRYLGWKIAVSVGILDVFKGLLPIVIARWLDAPHWLVAVMAVVATIGHCWCPFLKFRGGKGMATGGGAAIGMLPILFLMLPLMIVIVAITRYVSLASLIVAVTGTTMAFAFAATTDFPWSHAGAVLCIAVIVIGKHRGNIARLRAGEERRFGASEIPGDAA
jgi:glycerol-3-phosphate acyltransferase PlsY